jgi:16S rRNA processing protein RimM
VADRQGGGAVPDSRYILIGKLQAAHGTGGGLKLKSYAESLALFAPGLTLLAVCAGKAERTCEIERVKPQGRTAILRLKGVATRSAAEALAGCELFIDKACLPELAEGVYYWSDLIGTAVYEAQGHFLGRLESIFRTGSNDVYVVKDPHSGREILIPALKAVIAAVDLAAGRMEVNLPEGLV